MLSPTHDENKYSNLDWKQYRKLSHTEKFEVTVWLAHEEFLGRCNAFERLKDLQTTEIHYKVCLIKKGVRRFFVNYKEAGGFLGVHFNKVFHNKGRQVNKWYVTPCEYMEIINGWGEVVDSTTCVLPYSVI